MSRMTLGRVAFTVVGLFALGACASSLSRVPVKGEETSIARIVGDWEGQYDSVDLGRQGTITFHLEMGRHTAVGHVTMYADGPMGPGRSIRITSVKVAGRKIEGRLAGYGDPRCGCQVSTTFSGELAKAGTINGTFTTTPAGSDTGAVGRWALHRIQ